MMYKFETKNEWEAQHLMCSVNYRIDVQSLIEDVKSRLKHGAAMSSEEVLDALLEVESDYPIREV